VEAVSVLLKPRWLALHAFTVVVVVGCVGAAWWQFLVAKDGSGRSLGYALQWPAIAVFGIGVWAWLCRDGVRAARDGDRPAPERPERPAAPRPPAPVIDAEADPELAAYNAMLARLAERDGR